MDATAVPPKVMASVFPAPMVRWAPVVFEYWFAASTTLSPARLVSVVTDPSEVGGATPNGTGGGRATYGGASAALNPLMTRIDAVALTLVLFARPVTTYCWPAAAPGSIARSKYPVPS